MKQKKYRFLNPQLPVDERIKELLSLMSVEEKIGFIPVSQSAVPRLGIKEWHVGGEVARGYVSHDETEFATVFPQPIGMASMFDTGLMEKIGEAAAAELRYFNMKNHPDGHLMLWGPTVDLCRDPRWGRTEECYGEDPYLAGSVSTAYTKGLSGNGKHIFSSPSLKHFFANNHEDDRTRDSSNIEPRIKHEYYYSAFRPAIKAGYALGVMTSYNEINGVPAMINSDINTVCKKKWGMKYAVTDGGDFIQTVTAHRFTENNAQTLALALKNGTDMMCDEKELVISAAKEALRCGLISEKDIDKAVANSLYPRFRLGEFDDNSTDEFAHIKELTANNEDFRKLNLQAAREAVTLLKNNALLPLEKDKVKTVAVLGINGSENMRDWYTGTSGYQITVADGLERLLGKNNVICDRCEDEIALKSKLTGKYLRVDENDNIAADGKGISKATTFIKSDYDGEIVLRSKLNGMYLTDSGRITASGATLFSWFTREVIRPEKTGGFLRLKNLNHVDICVDTDGFLASRSAIRCDDSMLFEEKIVSSGIKRAAELAAKTDCVIVCTGNNPMLIARECYDRKDLELPSHQKRLVESVFSANRKTLMLIVSSYPYAIREEKEKIPAIIYTAHGGAEMGNAVADVIFGLYNPAGRTPLTWYKSADELPDIKDYDIVKNKSTYLYYNREPLYPFGFGLSYSEFSYSNLSVKDGKKSIRVEVDVANISDKGGDEVVQLYFSALDSPVKRPLRQLCGFKRLFIDANKSEHIVFDLSKEALSFWDVSRDVFSFRQGEYGFFAGGSSADSKCTATAFLSGETIPPRNIRKKISAINYDDNLDITIRYSKSEEAEFIESGGMKDGIVVYRNCDCSEVSEFCIKAASIGLNSRIGFFADEVLIGEITIPTSVYPDKFDKYTLKFKKMPSGSLRDIRVSVSPNTRLLSFKAK